MLRSFLFADPGMQQLLTDVQLLRPDVAANDAVDQRITDELSAGAFLARLDRARKG